MEKRLDAEASHDRLAREARFHDASVSDGVRATAGKFYSITLTSRRRYQQLVSAQVRGKRVLDYGCGTGASTFEVARLGGQVVGIDISPRRLDVARQRAADEGLTDQVQFVVGDAEHLPFDAGSFDLVVGGAILHHLDLEAAYAEIARLLKPNGSALFIEPLGHNPLINWYRRRTPDMRTPDEHPLLMSDIRLAARTFARVDVEFYHLLSLGIVPLRSTPLFGPLYALAEGLDRLAMAIIPPLRGWAWNALIQLHK